MKAFQMNVSLLDRLLQCVVSVFRVLKPAERDIKHSFVVALEESFERGAGAADGRSDENLVLYVRAAEIHRLIYDWLWCSGLGFELHSCVSFEISRCCSLNDSKTCFM